jgi:membrane-associated protease RseP (regulator of RpoE activity)
MLGSGRIPADGDLMAFTLTIVGFVIALFAIVMIHELGHYLMARAYGFRVLEYFLGFGPKLWSFRRGEIEYGVKAIPVGGYVKIAGMNPYVNDVPPGDEGRAYGARPRWQRALVILAGPMSHFIVGGLIFAAVLAIWGHPTGPWRIDDVPQKLETGSASPAFSAGLEPGDEILSIGGISTVEDGDLNGIITSHIGQPVDVVVDRGGQQLTFTVVPASDVVDGQDRGRLGVVVTAIGTERVSIPSAVVEGFGDVGTFAWHSVGQVAHVFGPQGIGRLFDVLFTGAPRARTDSTTVVGVSRQIGAAGQQGDWELAIYQFAAVVIFIGLVNLIPLPPFDGGHLAVLAIEKIRGRSIDIKKMVPVSAVVLAVLVFLTLSTLVLDIWKPVPISP